MAGRAAECKWFISSEVAEVQLDNENIQYVIDFVVACMCKGVFQFTLIVRVDTRFMGRKVVMMMNNFRVPAILI